MTCSLKKNDLFLLFTEFVCLILLKSSTSVVSKISISFYFKTIDILHIPSFINYSFTYTLI